MPGLFVLFVALAFLLILIIIFAKIVRFALLLLLILLLCAGVLTFFVIADLRDLSKPHEQPTLFLLLDNGEPLVAFVSDNKDMPLGDSWKEIRDGYPDNLDILSLEYYKIIAIDASLLNMLNQSDLPLDIKTIPLDLAIATLLAKDPLLHLHRPLSRAAKTRRLSTKKPSFPSSSGTAFYLSRRSIIRRSGRVLLQCILGLHGIRSLSLCRKVY